MTTVLKDRSDTLLRGALKANAAFSMAAGIVATVMAGPIGEFMGVPTLAVVIVGVGVVLFGVAILINARRADVSRGEARLTVFSDVAWVVAAAILIVGFPEVMTTGGKILLGGVSVVVGIFAVLQWFGLRRAGTG